MGSTMTKIRSYSELVQLDTFTERLRYLQLSGGLGIETFGSSRFINQDFYRLNPLWKAARREVILRDQGRDLGIEGLEINRGLYVHHMNPITIEDLENQTEFLLNPEYLICCSHKTHNAIHYGHKITENTVVERKQGDTCPWR